MNRVVPDIVGCQEPRSDLSLKTEIPLVDIHLLEVPIQMFRVVDVEPCRWKRSILGGEADSDG